ncbi:IPT/TIG domain-containing protein [Labilibaculum sp. K2S]|uniref:IPT/TIG domain-containing protein n=1 Tax=Labilibaculum sp. K2S TaxID=3056386 RepID=UPI0025A374CF|nr:IPT/TIG domain-containing protein [Labilibaculum sp. K2S]MDM8159319.1 IPT/TIG domain-containing protein [Labilibaculum sp. K2S]
MKSYIKNIQFLVVFMVLAVIYSGCDKDPEIKMYTYPAPLPTGFSPASGYAGTLITIEGSDFGDYKNAVSVFFNGVESDLIVSCKDDEIVAQVPDGAISGKISLKVWTEIIDSIGSYIVIPSSKVSYLSSERGKPGDEVSIIGEKFGTDMADVQIFIGDAEAVVTSVSDNEIKFTIPDASSGALVLYVGTQVIPVSYFLIGDELLTGTLIGHSGSWGDNPATYITAAVDGDITTFVDGATKIGYVGYDVGEGKTALLTSVRYVPRASHPQRMTGGEIRGANDPTLFDAVTLYTITEEPTVEVYTEAAITTNESYRYIYYYSDEGNCNIAEIEFYGNITDAVIPEGKFMFEFDDPTAANYWVGVNSSTPTNVIEDGKLKVTFNASQFEGTNKRRADLKYVEGGIFPGDSPTGAWRYSSEYPILAYKISFTGTGAAAPVAGNIKLDRFDNKNNSYLVDFISDNVIYYDISTVITESQDLASWQLKIADITSTEETGYEVDWIRTFKNKEELQAFIGQ